MGLFSKKSYVCECCGKTFEKRVNLIGNICDDCLAERERQKAAMEAHIGGYMKYAAEVLDKTYTVEEMAAVKAHKEELIRSISQYGMSEGELKRACAKLKSLSDDEFKACEEEIYLTAYQDTIGACYSPYFFVPTGFDAMLVRTSDIFAVGYRLDASFGGKVDALLYTFFTNDPYVPVFPVVWAAEKRMFKLKNEEAREGVKAFIEANCENLTYPIMDISDLSKMIKKEGTVRGNIAKDKMQSFISDAQIGSSIFNTKEMESGISSLKTLEMLDELNFYPMNYVADQILHAYK